jgi:hypothetical protein
MIKAICFSKVSVLTRATWHNIPEDGILHIEIGSKIKAISEIQLSHLHRESVLFMYTVTTAWKISIYGTK